MPLFGTGGKLFVLASQPQGLPINYFMHTTQGITIHEVEFYAPWNAFVLLVPSRRTRQSASYHA
jgi:hypothetical protein